MIYALIIMFIIEGPGPGVRAGFYPDLPACLQAGENTKPVTVDNESRVSLIQDRMTYFCQPINQK